MYIIIAIYVTGFDKSRLPHTQWQGWLFTTTWSMNLTIHVCIIANGSLVYFSWGLFLKPVWRAWVLRWSLNGSDVTEKASTWLEITTRLARKLGHQIGYYLWYLELEWASGETFWLGLHLICWHNFKNNR